MICMETLIRFDLPELSYGILTTCEKFESNLMQYTGRLVRKHPTKKDPVFYDVVDHLQYLLKNQSKKRLETFKKFFPDGKISII